MWQQFLQQLNQNEFNLSFTNSFSDKEISFLDVLIRIEAVGTIGTTLFRKSSAGNSLLRADSAHPVALKKSIPLAQYMRLRRICASLEDFEIQAGELQKRFLARGYSRTLLKRAYHKAKMEDRHCLLYKNVDKNARVTAPPMNQ